MFATALDDLHMIKFKQAWFTLIKYDHEVFEKKNQKLREELVEFSAQNKIDKPRTWLSQFRMPNKFREEEEPVEIAQKQQEQTEKPKS